MQDGDGVGGLTSDAPGVLGWSKEAFTLECRGCTELGPSQDLGTVVWELPESIKRQEAQRCTTKC